MGSRWFSRSLLATSSLWAATGTLAAGCAAIVGIDDVSLRIADDGLEGGAVDGAQRGDAVSPDASDNRLPVGPQDGSASPNESGPDNATFFDGGTIVQGPDAADAIVTARSPDAAEAGVVANPDAADASGTLHRIDASDGGSDADATMGHPDAPPGVCTPAATQCSGHLVQTCDTSGQWGPASTCSGPNESCLASSCQPCPGATLACSGACVDTSADQSNCGACGQACGGTCSGGVCTVVLARGQGSPEGVVVDATSVYWTNDGVDGLGSIAKTSLDGGTVVRLASGLNDPRCLTIDGANVYWANFGTGANNYADGSIMSVPIAGGTIRTIATSQGGPNGITVDATTLYWTQYDGSSVMKWALQGGAPTVLVPNVGGSFGIAVDSTHVYWTTFSNPGTVQTMPLIGGTPTVLASGQAGGTSGIAIDSTSVYFTNEEDTAGVNNGSVKKVLKAGGTVATLSSPPTSAGRHIVVDGTSVYWTNNNDGTVTKEPLAGGPKTILASGQSYPEGIAVDATSVYWANYGDGTLVKRTPK